MSQSIRWGILGAGTVTHHFAMGLQTVPGAKLVAVASRTEKRARAFATAHGVPRVYTSYPQLVEDGEVDIVYIATPNARHREDALLALGANKPVLLEKPFALNAAEALEIIQTARQRKLFCMEAMWMRFMPLMRHLDRYLVEIGEPRLLTAQLAHPFEYDEQSRLFNPQAGGGALLDLGVYLVSFAVRLFGEPLSTAGFSGKTPNGVDDQFVMALEFSGQRTASLSASLRSEGTNDAVILGDRGRLHIGRPLYRPESLSVVRFAPESPQVNAPSTGIMGSLRLNPWIRSLRRTAVRVLPVLDGGNRQVNIPFRGNGYGYEAAEVHRCLRESRLESDVMPLDQTLCVARVLDAVRDAAQASSRGRREESTK